MTYKLNEGDDWVVYRSPAVEHESAEMVAQIGRAYRHFKNTFTGLDSSLRQDGLTVGALPALFDVEDQYKKDIQHLKDEGDFSGYRFYNLFSLTAPSPLFWLLLRDIRNCVRETINTDEPLWIQCWMNLHKPDEVLGWHDHHFPYHGYVSIDPKDSTTEFKEGDLRYEIKNEVGNIYFGPGWNRMHRVRVDSPYEGERITLGFDIETQPDLPDDQFSLIPLL